MTLPTGTPPAETPPVATGPAPRAVRWGTLPYARDLGGLPTAAGGRTRPGRLYRTSRLDDAGSVGLAVMVDAGVRTVVDLRNASEVGPLELPPSVTRHRRPVEDPDDAEFMQTWGGYLHTPRYYATVLERWRLRGPRGRPRRRGPRGLPARARRDGPGARPDPSPPRRRAVSAPPHARVARTSR